MTASRMYPLLAFCICILCLLRIALQPESTPRTWFQWTLLAVISSFILVFAFGHTHRNNAPNSPPIVKSRIPWIGHAFSYIRSPAPFLRACRLRYGSVYKFLAGGRYIVFLSTPSTISNFMQNSAKSFDIIEYQMIGVINDLPDSSRLPYIYSIVDQKAVVAMAHGLTRKNIVQLTIAFNLDLHKRLLSSIADGPQVVVSLRDFVQRSLFHSNNAAYLGPHFPLDGYEDFIAFDKDVVTILARIPLLGRRGKQARKRLTSILSEYVDHCWQEEDGGYLEGGSDAISALLRELKNSEMSQAEAISVLFYFTWGIQASHLRMTFWVMAYILTDQDAYRRIQQEIRGVFTERFPDINAFLNIDPAVLDGPEFSLLTSTIMEVVRMTSLPASFRKALRDTEILGADGDTILIRKGEYVVADIRAVHFDPTVYDDPNTFKIDRFLSTASTAKWPNDRLYGFGGGSHMCKGRNYAMHSMRVFVILCVHLFDMAPVSVGSSRVTVPRVDPSSFLIPVVQTQDELFISLRRAQYLKF